MTLSQQITWLFMLSIPVACIAWTVTHEEIFSEPREYCERCCKERKTLLARKFFYVFTCEYCFSHYVTILILIVTGFKLLYTDWRGYLISGFSIVWVANLYMSIFGLLRTDLKKEKAEGELKQEELGKKEE
ncbi:MAG: hypothetical protein ABJA79_00210 [Parafilimonas sp.]